MLQRCGSSPPMLRAYELLVGTEDRKMNRNHVIAITGLAFMLGAGTALAQDEEELDATISVMDSAEAATPDVFVTGILLPEDAVLNADATANVDEELVNDALARRQFGLDTAAANAIEEVTSDFAEAAQDAAENSSRAEEVRPDLPDDLPGQPGG